MDLSASIHLLGDLLGEVLSAQESPALFETEERIRALAKARRGDDEAAGPALAGEMAALSADAARAVASAFTLYFDLVNLAEEAHRVGELRRRAFERHPEPVAESLGAAVAALHARGVTPGEIEALVRGLRIELVLTAHPTEARRRTVMSKLQRIAHTLRRLRASDLLPREREAAVSAIRAEITAPWVFSWMQSRFNLPGWYGLGAALDRAAGDRLAEMYAGWPLVRALVDNAEMSLLKADMGIAELYAELVPDRSLAEPIFGRIVEEYERTRKAILRVTGHGALMDADPVIQRSVHLRNPYVDPLNYLQVEMLRRLRALPDADGAEAERLREVIALTINGIAAGLRNTG